MYLLHLFLIFIFTQVKHSLMQPILGFLFFFLGLLASLVSWLLTLIFG